MTCQLVTRAFYCPLTEIAFYTSWTAVLLRRRPALGQFGQNMSVHCCLCQNTTPCYTANSLTSSSSDGSPHVRSDVCNVLCIKRVAPHLTLPRNGSVFHAIRQQVSFQWRYHCLSWWLWKSSWRTKQPHGSVLMELIANTHHSQHIQRSDYSYEFT